MGKLVVNGIQDAVGCLLFCPRFDKELTGGEDRYYHLVLLAETNEGYANLVKIVSKGLLEPSKRLYSVWVCKCTNDMLLPPWLLFAIAVAETNEGYANLVKIVSKGYVEGFYYRPRVDMEVLEQYHKGIIALSACLAGEVQRYIIKGLYDEIGE